VAVRTLALVLEYDGGAYKGFQRQPGRPTVQERVEEGLAVLFGARVALRAAGRTDAGVHATGQVVSCSVESDLAPRRICVAASAILRGARIAVLHAEERESGFNARRHALARTYRYRILNRPSPSPLLAGRAFHVSLPLNVEAMRIAASCLIGEHDFASFAGREGREKSTLRTVHAVEVTPAGPCLDIVMTADSFVHNMVRIVAGTLIEIGRGRRAPDEMAAILSSKQRAGAGFTAPAHGLYLEAVRYDPPLAYRFGPLPPVVS
jgi:tRNA pseudouridine38-40 synthase